MIARRLLRLGSGVVALAGVLLLADAAHAVCLGPRGNFVACPPGVPNNATISSAEFAPKPPGPGTTIVQFDAPPFIVGITGPFTLSPTLPDAARTYGALRFLDYGLRGPEGWVAPGSAWPRVDEFAQPGPAEKTFERYSAARAALLFPPRAIRGFDAATVGVPELVVPRGR